MELSIHTCYSYFNYNLCCYFDDNCRVITIIKLTYVTSHKYYSIGYSFIGYNAIFVLQPFEICSMRNLYLLFIQISRETKL